MPATDPRENVWCQPVQARTKQAANFRITLSSKNTGPAQAAIATTVSAETSGTESLQPNLSLNHRLTLRLIAQGLSRAFYVLIMFLLSQGVPFSAAVSVEETQPRAKSSRITTASPVSCGTLRAGHAVPMQRNQETRHAIEGRPGIYLKIWLLSAASAGRCAISLTERDPLGFTQARSGRPGCGLQTARP